MASAEELGVFTLHRGTAHAAARTHVNRRAYLNDVIRERVDEAERRAFADGPATSVASIEASINVSDETRALCEWAESGDVAISAHFCCPISCSLMKEPVVAPDGFSYEKCYIQRHFTRSNWSPMTNLELPSVTCHPNIALRQVMEATIWEHTGLEGSDRTLEKLKALSPPSAARSVGG